MRRPLPRLALIAVAAVGAGSSRPAPLAAQRLPSARFARATASNATLGEAPLDRARLLGARPWVVAADEYPPALGDARRQGGPWWAPLASAVLPGAGQAVQRQRRAVPYLAAEAFLIAQYLDARDEGRERRTRYRGLARIARGPYSAVFPTGDFEYYESMEHFVESGVFDLVPGGAIDPEIDTTTFNGTTWRLARQTFWENPDEPPPRESAAYRNAIDFYARRAVRPEFRWSWRNAQLEQDLYRRTVQGSNDAFRLSSQYLGAIIANHALSAVDAFVRLRITRRVSPERVWSLDGTIPWAPLGRPRGGAARMRP